jgi:hypothetical protein
MRTPSMEPLNSRPSRPWIDVTDAERMIVKSSGAFSGSIHCTPISSMRIGRKDGHWNVEPVAEPMPRNTPNPRRTLNVPSPRKWKLRASPVSARGPMFTVAPIDSNESMTSVVPIAPVSRRRLRARRVTKVPKWISRVSIVSWKASTLPFVNVRPMRKASVSFVPSGRRSSVVSRSSSVALNGFPGNSLAPPVAM